MCSWDHTQTQNKDTTLPKHLPQHKKRHFNKGSCPLSSCTLGVHNKVDEAGRQYRLSLGSLWWLIQCQTTALPVAAPVLCGSKFTLQISSLSQCKYIYIPLEVPSSNYAVQKKGIVYLGNIPCKKKHVHDWVQFFSPHLPSCDSWQSQAKQLIVPFYLHFVFSPRQAFWSCMKRGRVPH